MKLTGWQRLWIVIGALYGLIVAAFTPMGFPTEKGIHDMWAWRVIHETESDITSQAGIASYQFNLRDLHKGKSDLDIANELSAKRIAFERKQTEPRVIEGSAALKAKLAELDDERRKKVDGLTAAQAKYIAGAVAIWIVPCLLVYALGLTARWIWRGFFPAKA